MTATVDKAQEELQIDQDTMQGMFLTFDLAGEGYGLEIRYVTEIIGIQKVTNVPDMPEHVIGVLNLRGKVIPIIDVRLRFDLPLREYDERTCIIVVDVNDNPVGLVVDQVSEVVDIAEKDIEPPPATGKGGGHYIQGLGKIAEKVKILLNVEALVEDDAQEENLTEMDVA
jgi:purine-binding chemotaxis protein CheW